MDFSGGLAPFTGISEAEWAERQQRIRDQPWTEEDERRKREQERSRLSHVDMELWNLSIDFLDRDGQLLETCVSREDRQGRVVITLPQVLVNELIHRDHELKTDDGVKRGVMRIRLREHHIVSGITY
jgi:hypothetical protein